MEEKERNGYGPNIKEDALATSLVGRSVRDHDGQLAFMDDYDLSERDRHLAVLSAQERQPM